MNESKEMYLETILVLNERIGKVKSIDVVHEMGFSKPTVSIAMKKLKSDKLIAIDKDGYISLLDEGTKIANQIYDRHKLLTSLLTKLGVSPKIAEKDACKIEHNVSDETFEKLKNYYKKM